MGRKPKPGVTGSPFKRYLRLNMMTTLREFLDETVGRCLQQYNNTNFFSIYIYTLHVYVYIYINYGWQT